jgi:hypothetical protein
LNSEIPRREILMFCGFAPCKAKGLFFARQPPRGPDQRLVNPVKNRPSRGDESEVPRPELGIHRFVNGVDDALHGGIARSSKVSAAGNGI